MMAAGILMASVSGDQRPTKSRYLHWESVRQHSEDYGDQCLHDGSVQQHSEDSVNQCLHDRSVRQHSEDSVCQGLHYGSVRQDSEDAVTPCGKFIDYEREKMGKIMNRGGGNLGHGAHISSGPVPRGISPPNRTQDMETQANLLKGHSENINTFISTNATFESQVLGLESKSEDFLRYLQVERQRIDNVESELNTLDETVKKAQPEIRKNSERLDDLEAHQINNVKNLDDIQPSPRQCKGDSFSQTNDGQPEQQSRRYRGQIEAE